MVRFFSKLRLLVLVLLSVLLSLLRLLLQLLMLSVVVVLMVLVFIGFYCEVEASHVLPPSFAQIHQQLFQCNPSLGPLFE